MSKQKTEKNWKKELLSWVKTLAVAVALALIIRSFLFQIIRVQGDSMLDTLQTGDRVYVSVLTPKIWGYERGDIAICVYPGADHDCIKRVVAIPGDTVQVIKGEVFVNGEKTENPPLSHKATYTTDEITLGEGEYYVLGDNRPISHDSHSQDVGVVTDMVGKVRCVIWPLSRIGTKLD